MIATNKGSIINISSTSGLDANFGRVSYASSKSSLITATEVISKEVGSYNVRVNAIAPGVSDTDMFNMGHSDKIKKNILGRISLKRIKTRGDSKCSTFYSFVILCDWSVIRVDGEYKIEIFRKKSI